MANNLESNTTEDLARIFLDHFESNRVVTKTVDTNIIRGKLNPSNGGIVSVKRPHDYNTIETATGDISASTKSDIIAGKATSEVQNYITTAMEWGDKEQSLELDQLEEITIAPAARRIVTKLESNLGTYMRTRSGLSYGTPGTTVDSWADVAGAGAFMSSIGVPSDMDHFYLMNPFTTTNLADTQSGLASGSNNLVDTAWEKAQISSNFGGLNALTSNALTSYTSGSGADRAGTLSATPTATYVSVKDTMTQTLAVTAFEANLEVKAGEIIEVTGRFFTNIATRDLMFDETGSQVKWRATVTADVTLGASGEGNIVVTGPAIFEADGQYNNISSALTSGDVVTLLGAADTAYQPNMFYHKQAFGMSTVKLSKLHATDTIMTTEDGISIRITKYSDGDKNQQKIRFDILPAFITLNPQFAGLGFGK